MIRAIFSWLDSYFPTVTFADASGNLLPQRGLVKAQAGIVLTDDAVDGETLMSSTASSQVVGWSTSTATTTVAAPYESTLNFVGSTVTDNPGKTRVDVVPLEKSAPISGLVCAAGVATLLAEVDQVADASGTVFAHGSVNGAVVGGSMTTCEYFISYGTSSATTNTVQHGYASTSDMRFGQISCVIPGLTPGLAYKFGFSVKPNGDTLTTTAGAGGLYIHESAR